MDSVSDYSQVSSKITERLKAILSVSNKIENLKESSPLAPTSGLTPHEIAFLSLVVSDPDPAGMPQGYLWQAMGSAGFTGAAAGLALRSLLRKEMVRTSDDRDVDGVVFKRIYILESGDEWLLANQDKLLLRKSPKRIKPNLDEMKYDENNPPF